MSEKDDDFFAGKRPWSVIKDQVLKQYMSPYVAKVIKRGQPIFLIDGYAGPGVFEDGKPGSPMIMCQAAEKYAKGKWSAIFFNNERKYHDKLGQVIQRAGWSHSVTTKLGDTTKLLQQLPTPINKHSVFLYLDPFGPTGCDFSLLKPFLDRNPDYSTEILLTMNMPGMHRLATPEAVRKGRQDEQMIKDFHQKLTKVFDGEYWQDILWQDTEAEAKEYQLIEAYRRKLNTYLPFVCFCPVRERTDKRIKYFIVFASRHKDAIVLLNDFMANAYFSEMHKADNIGKLWGEIDWHEMRSTRDLEKVILQTVVAHPGETRKFLWSRIVIEHFMRYLEPEYKNAVQELVDNNKLISPTPRPKKRLNDECKLYPASS